MSATLRMDDFTANRRLFPLAPPLLHVPARQYPVTLHFNRRTELDDFVGAAHHKVAVLQSTLLSTPLSFVFVVLCLASAFLALLDLSVSGARPFAEACKILLLLFFFWLHRVDACTCTQEAA